MKAIWRCVHCNFESYLTMVGLIYISNAVQVNPDYFPRLLEVPSKVQALYFGSKVEIRLAPRCPSVQKGPAVSWAVPSHCFINCPCKVLVNICQFRDTQAHSWGIRVKINTARTLLF